MHVAGMILNLGVVNSRHTLGAELSLKKKKRKVKVKEVKRGVNRHTQEYNLTNKSVSLKREGKNPSG